MALVCAHARPLTQLRAARAKAAASRPARSVRVHAKKSSVKEAPAAPEDVGTLGLVAIATGLISNPIALYSEYTLKTTGSGLPPGPGGLYGAAEGISYLVVVGIVTWSLYTKSSTGSGLPAGPAGLLGAVEGLSFLTILGGIVVFGLQVAEKGSLPGIFG